jgi:hypothetical protein
MQWIALIVLVLTGTQLVTARYQIWGKDNLSVSQTHHQAPIIDGPDALRQKLQRARRAPIHAPALGTRTVQSAQTQVDSGRATNTIDLFLVVDAIGIAMLVVSICKARKYNREVWAPGMAIWNDSFLCKGCGQVFLPR